MEISWLGNSTFLIKNSTGKKILINPINLNSYVKNYDINPDLITLSNFPYGDGLTNYLKSGCEVINSCVKFTNDYISIKGYSTYSDNVNGLKRGTNNIYIFKIDNIKFCHLGTLGHKLDSNLISKLKDLDFLFIPIGGHFSLKGIDAAILSNNINPKYIIPMLYKTSLENSHLDGPFEFISQMKNIKKINCSKIQTSDLNFNNHNTSVIMLTP